MMTEVSARLAQTLALMQGAGTAAGALMDGLKIYLNDSRSWNYSKSW